LKYRELERWKIVRDRMEKRRKKMKANDNIWKEERKCERKKE
jgi:hypothetical protein